MRRKDHFGGPLTDHQDEGDDDTDEETAKQDDLQEGMPLGNSGSGGGTRTPDTRIMIPLL